MVALPVALAWCLLAVFLVLAVAAAHRLGPRRPDSTGVVRQSDMADFLLLLAMASEVSPIGGPIPPAGWQTVFLLVGAWFMVAATKRRSATSLGQLHVVVSAAAMFYMATVMPHDHSMHGSTVSPPLVVALTAYFALDGVRASMSVPRSSDPDRIACRAVMSLGMAYLFAVTL